MGEQTNEILAAIQTAINGTTALSDEEVAAVMQQIVAFTTERDRFRAELDEALALLRMGGLATEYEARRKALLARHPQQAPAAGPDGGKETT